MEKEDVIEKYKRLDFSKQITLLFKDFFVIRMVIWFSGISLLLSFIGGIFIFFVYEVFKPDVVTTVKIGIIVSGLLEIAWITIYIFWFERKEFKKHLQKFYSKIN